MTISRKISAFLRNSLNCFNFSGVQVKCSQHIAQLESHCQFWNTYVVEKRLVMLHLTTMSLETLALAQQNMSEWRTSVVQEIQTTLTRLMINWNKPWNKWSAVYSAS